CPEVTRLVTVDPNRLVDTTGRQPSCQGVAPHRGRAHRPGSLARSAFYDPLMSTIDSWGPRRRRLGPPAGGCRQAWSVRQATRARASPASPCIVLVGTAWMTSDRGRTVNVHGCTVATEALPLWSVVKSSHTSLCGLA